MIESKLNKLELISENDIIKIKDAPASIIQLIRSP